MHFTGAPVLAENAGLIKRLARLSEVTEAQGGEGLFLTQTPYRCWLDIDRKTAQAYLERLAAQQAREEQAIKQLKGRLANKRYTEHAPAHVVDETRGQLGAAKAQLASIQQESKKFKAL
jgi:valyl-tRNA synthetase